MPNNFQNNQPNTKVDQFRKVGNEQLSEDKGLGTNNLPQYQQQESPQNQEFSNTETKEYKAIQTEIETIKSNQEKILTTLSDFADKIKDISQDMSNEEEPQVDPTNTQNVQPQTIENQTSTPNPTQYVESNQTPTPETSLPNETPDPTNDPNSMNELAKRLGSNLTQNSQPEQTQQSQPQSVASQYNPQNEF